MISSSSMTRMDPRPVRRAAAASEASSARHRQACLFAACGATADRDDASGSVEREARALADGAVAGDRAAVLLHDAVGDRQAEAGALADLLRREERIVDPRELFGRNPGAGVGDFDRRADRALRLRDDREPAALRHRVARVQEQVQEHLLELVLDALHDDRRARESSFRTWMLPVRNW